MRQEKYVSSEWTALGTAASLAVMGGMLMRAFIRHRRSVYLHGKTVLITGGSRGLGLVLARRFAGEGCNVVICARDENELDRARKELAGHGANVLSVQCDVTSNAQVAGMMDGIVRHFGSIDVLVNNAGLIQVGSTDDMTLADYDHAMQTHFWAPLYTIQAALPHMRRQGGGRIVNIASIGGKIAVPHLLPYSASKFALVGLSEGLRAELMKDGILVTTVCPGLMRTGSPRNADFKGQHEKEYAWFSAADVLPLVSMSANRMAARIVKACRQGDAELILPFSASLPIKLHGLFPGLTSDLLAIQNHFLPGAGGIGKRTAKGYDSEARTPDFARRRNESAAMANNEIPPAM